MFTVANYFHNVAENSFILIQEFKINLKCTGTGIRTGSRRIYVYITVPVPVQRKFPL
jgi:hypothetical protein